MPTSYDPSTEAPRPAFRCGACDAIHPTASLKGRAVRLRRGTTIYRCPSCDIEIAPDPRAYYALTLRIAAGELEADTLFEVPPAD